MDGMDTDSDDMDVSLDTWMLCAGPANAAAVQTDAVQDFSQQQQLTRSLPFTEAPTHSKPFQVLMQPLLKVLREQLAPGELDAAARVCRTWASQLAHDVVHCEMCLPGCYELLLCQLEQLAKRFKNVHDWHLWLPAGAQWGLMNDLLWLLSRYKAEKLQLDGRLSWHPRCAAQLPELDSDVFPWMASMRSLQSLRLTHCTLAASSGLAYVAFLTNVHTLEFGLRVASPDAWVQDGLDPWLRHLSKLRQVVEMDLHVEGTGSSVLVLPAQLPEQIQRLFAACTKLQRFSLHLGQGWGVMQDHECVVYQRAAGDADAAGAAAGAISRAGAAASSHLAFRQQPAGAAAAPPVVALPSQQAPASVTTGAAGQPVGTAGAAAGAATQTASSAAATSMPLAAPHGDLQQQLGQHQLRLRHRALTAAAAASDAPAAGEADGQDMQGMEGADEEGGLAFFDAADGSPSPRSSQFGRRQRGGSTVGDDAWQRLVAQRSSITSSPRKQLVGRRSAPAAAAAGLEDAAAAAAGRRGGPGGNAGAGSSGGNPRGRSLPASLVSMLAAKRAAARARAQGSDAGNQGTGVNLAVGTDRLPRTRSSSNMPQQGLSARTGFAAGSRHGTSGGAGSTAAPGSEPLPLSLLDRELGGTGSAAAAAAAAAAAGAAAPRLGPMQLISRELGGIASPLPYQNHHHQQQQQQQQRLSSSTSVPPLNPAATAVTAVGDGGVAGDGAPLGSTERSTLQSSGRFRDWPSRPAASAATDPAAPSAATSTAAGADGSAGAAAGGGAGVSRVLRRRKQPCAAAASPHGSSSSSESWDSESSDSGAGTEPGCGMDIDADSAEPKAGGTGCNSSAAAAAALPGDAGGMQPMQLPGLQAPGACLGHGNAAAAAAGPPAPAGPQGRRRSSIAEVHRAMRRRMLGLRARIQGLGGAAGAAAADEQLAPGAAGSDSDLEELLGAGAPAAQPRRNRRAAAAEAPAASAPAAAAAAGTGAGAGGGVPAAAAAGGRSEHPLERFLSVMPPQQLVAQGLAGLLPLQQAVAPHAAAAEQPEADGAADEAQAAAAAAEPVDPIRVLQFNRATTNPQGVFVLRLVLEGLSGPSSLQQRLWQQLAGSPALNLLALDLRFAQNSVAVQGSGRFWQQLLEEQVPLLAELRLSGIGSCETGFEVPHMWECIRPLKGLTRLSYNTRAASGNTVVAPPQPPEGSAAAMAAVLQAAPQPDPPAAVSTEKLRLDSKLMQTLVQLRSLESFEFVGDLSGTLPRSLSGRPCSAALATASSFDMDSEELSPLPMDTAAGVGRTSSSSGGGSGGGGSSNSLQLAPGGTSVLTLLPQVSNLSSLVLEQWSGSLLDSGVNRRPSSAVMLDVAWLPPGLTTLKLCGITLSCRANRSYVESFGEAYAALLLRERERNTPDAWWQASADAAAAAASDPRGKAPMLLPHHTSSRRDRYSGLCSTAAPPVLLPKLTQLSVAHCCGVLPAIVGCFAHSTGLKSLELVFGYEPPPISLAAIAWMWPRITEARLSDHHNPGCSRRLLEDDSDNKGLGSSSRCSLSQAIGSSSSSQAVAAAAPKTLPNLLDELVTPARAAAWLWGSSSNKFRSSSGSSSSSSNATSMRLIEEVSRRAAAGRVSWADACGLAQLAAALPNLSKLSLQLPHRFNRDAVMKPLVAASQAAGSSSSRVHSSSSSVISKVSFGPVDLLVLSAAPRLRELVVELPAQLSTFDAAAAGIRQLTALHRLRLLDLKCSLESPITAVVRNLWVRQRAQPAAAGVGGGPVGGAVGADALSDDDADADVFLQPAAAAGNPQPAAPAQPALPGFGLPPMPPPLGGPLAGLGAHGRGGHLPGAPGAAQAGRGFGHRLRGGWAGGRGATAGRGLGLDGPMWRGVLAAHERAAASVVAAAQAAAAAAGGSGAAAGGGAAPQAQQQQDAEAGDGGAQGAAMTGAVGSLAQGVEQLMASNDGAGTAGTAATNAAAAAATVAGGDADGDISIWRSRAPRRITPTTVVRRDELAVFDQHLSPDPWDAAADEELSATMAAAAAAAAAGAAQPFVAVSGEAGHHEAAAEAAQQGAAAGGQPEAAARQPVAAAAEAPAAQPQAALQLVEGLVAADGGVVQAGGAAAAAAAAAVGVLAAAAGNGQAGGAAAAAAAAPAAEGGPAPEDLLSMYIDDDFWEEESNTDAADADAFMRDIHEAWAGDPEEPAGAAGGAGEGEDEPQPAEQQAAGADGAPAPAAPAAAAAGGGGVQGGAGGAAAAAGGGSGGGGAAQRKRRYKPTGLQAQLRHDMPSTSVFLRIVRG